MIGILWHPQEANASLPLCHFSPHRHPKCYFCEVMSVVMVTVCEPGIAYPLTSPLPPFACSSPPSLPHCQPTRSFSPSPHMPGNQSLKQMWSDCSNASFSQQPYNCARGRMKSLLGCGGGGEGRRFVVVRDWMCCFENNHRFAAVRQLQEGAYLSLQRIVPKLLWQAGMVAK